MMEGYFVLGLVIGIIVGVALRPPRIKRVIETEANALELVRNDLSQRITWAEERLLSSRCGWSEGDVLRRDLSEYRRLLNLLPEQSA